MERLHRPTDVKQILTAVVKVVVAVDNGRGGRARAVVPFIVGLPFFDKQLLFLLTFLSCLRLSNGEFFLYFILGGLCNKFDSLR